MWVEIVFKLVNSEEYPVLVQLVGTADPAAELGDLIRGQLERDVVLLSRHEDGVETATHTGIMPHAVARVSWTMVAEPSTDAVRTGYRLLERHGGGSWGR